MKKRLLLLFFIVIGLISISYAYAVCGGAGQPPCVCGNEPNSSLGYGQVIINNQYFSCNNNADSICPEDFQDAQNPSIKGNCGSCTDPDCTGTATGHVYDLYNRPIPKSVVTSRPVKWNSTSLQSLETSVLSNQDGSFTLLAPTGIYYLSASAEGYDTQLIETTIVRNQQQSQPEIVFNLANGTCHSDCTNYYGRCNAACEGKVFADGTCHFENPDVAQLCNNKLKGTTIFYASYSPTQAYFLDCCDNSPYLKYYASAGIQTNVMDNLIKIEKIVKYNDVPVKLIIAYWD